MTFSFIAWLALSLTGGLLALWAVWARHISRWRLVSLLGFLAAILISGGAILLSQGWATRCDLLLPGKYNLLTFSFDADRIYLFLETSYGPKACFIPYSDDDAEELQKNEEENGSEFEIRWGDQEGGYGVPGFGEEMGDISARPPNAGHKDKPEDEQPPMFGE